MRKYLRKYFQVIEFGDKQLNKNWLNDGKRPTKSDGLHGLAEEEKQFN